MGKIKNTFQKMSLKKSLVMLAALCLGGVSILSIITILIFSDMQQKILDTRPIVVTDYTMKNHEGTGSETTVVPQKYIYKELSKDKQIYYWIVTILMVILPVIYIIAASLMVAKFYYKLKLQIPLQNLKNGMYHISQQDLDFQIQYTTDDELGKLCDTFECMRNEIHKSNCKMWDMLQERKALTASISHDLRTPITVVNGYLDYLEKSMERKMLTEELLQTTIKNMAGAMSRLERYVDCVKDIQKMEEIEIRKEQYNLKEIIADITREFSVLAAQYGRKLIIHDLSQDAFIETDKDMLSKILENIFDNALRFSTDKIVLSIDEKKDYICFSIQDDGVGFTAEELNSATSFFYSSPTNGGNFGIGLSICKILCEKLGENMCLGNNFDCGAIITIKIKK